MAGVCFSQNSLSLAGNLAAILTGKVFAWLESNEEGSQGPVQSTPEPSREIERSSGYREFKMHTSWSLQGQQEINWDFKKWIKQHSCINTRMDTIFELDWPESKVKEYTRLFWNSKFNVSDCSTLVCFRSFSTCLKRGSSNRGYNSIKMIWKGDKKNFK